MYIYYQGQSSHKLCIKIRSIVLATCPVQANYVQCKPGHCLSVELGKQSTKHRKRINQPQEKDQLTTEKRTTNKPKNDQTTTGKWSTNHRKRINQPQEKDQPNTGKVSTNQRKRINQTPGKDQPTTGKGSTNHRKKILHSQGCVYSSHEYENNPLPGEQPAY